MERTSERRTTSGGSLVTAGLVMLVLALLLAWIPILGPAIGGFVGGWMAGTTRRGLGVAVIPAVAFAVIIGLVLALFDLPVIGGLAGIAVFVWVLVETLPMVVGAGLGGALAGGRNRPRG
jgi:hypothetical protein